MIVVRIVLISVGRVSSPSAGVSACAPISHCVTCRFPVLDNAEGGTACNECDQWCHSSQVCVGLPSDFIMEVLKHQGRGIKHVCTKCRLLPPAATAVSSGKLENAE